MSDERNKRYFKETFKEITAPSALVGKVMDMTNKKVKTVNIKKVAIIAVAVMAVIATTGAAVYAATDGGFFKDVTNLFGAVTGTEYLNATDEVSINVTDNMTVAIKFDNPHDAPYAFISEVKLGDYKIVDENGNEVVNLTGGNAVAQVHNGTAELTVDIPNGTLEDGNSYTFVVESFFGLSKADAPIEIKGEWHVGFVY